MVSDRFVVRLIRAREPQYQLAASVGMSPSRLSRIVQAKHAEVGPLTDADRRALEQIAARLGLTIAETFVE